MKVTITIDNVREVSDIVDAIEEAYLEDHMEDDDGNLYKGHRQFEVLGFDMTYTSEGDAVTWTWKGNMTEARVGAFYLTVSGDDFGRVVARVYGPHKSGASSSQAHCDSWHDAEAWAEQRAREETTD